MTAQQNIRLCLCVAFLTAAALAVSPCSGQKITEASPSDLQHLKEILHGRRLEAQAAPVEGSGNPYPPTGIDGDDFLPPPIVVMPNGEETVLVSLSNGIRSPQLVLPGGGVAALGVLPGNYLAAYVVHGLEEVGPSFGGPGSVFPGKALTEDDISPPLVVMPNGEPTFKVQLPNGVYFPQVVLPGGRLAALGALINGQLTAFILTPAE